MPASRWKLGSACRAKWLQVALILLCSRAAIAQRKDSHPKSFVLPTANPQLRIVADVFQGALRFNTCEGPCVAKEGIVVTIPTEFRGQLEQVAFQALDLGNGRRVLRAAVPLGEGGGRFQVLVAASLRSGGARILFADRALSGRSRFTSAEGVDEQATVLQVSERSGISQVMRGVARTGVHLCGRPALLGPQLLVADDLEFHATKLQRLSRRERANAIRLRLTPVAPAVPAALRDRSGVNPLKALAASSSKAPGKPEFLTDGLESTAWSEARGGTGRGEFVTFRADPEVGVSALEFLVRGSALKSQTGVAPKVIWLATDSGVFRLDWPEDAWAKPGQWYRATFPEAQFSHCYAVVLAKGQQELKAAQVTLTEVRAVSELAELSATELIALLSGSDAQGRAAAAELRQGEPSARRVLARQFSVLEGAARERAWEILGRDPCELSVALSARLLAVGTERERERALLRLQGCSSTAKSALASEYEGLEGAAAGQFLNHLSGLVPDMVVRLGLERLARVNAESAAQVRDAIYKASRREVSLGPLRQALASSDLVPGVTLHLLRALAPPFERFEPAFSTAFQRAVSQAKTFDAQYLLLEPAAHVVRIEGRGALAATRFLLEGLSAADPHLRAAAAQRAPLNAQFAARLIALSRDPNVRVRQAAVQRLAEVRRVDASVALTFRLRDDRWPLVRIAALRSLIAQPDAPGLEKQLVRSLENDSAPDVRRLAIEALGRRGEVRFGDLLLEHLVDPQEALRVRGAAATALGRLCYQSAIPELTRLAGLLAGTRLDEATGALATRAVAALGQLAPADLSDRLLPLAVASAAPSVRRAAQESLEVEPNCSTLRNH